MRPHPVKEKEMPNKASHHNPLPAPSRISRDHYHPQPESMPRPRQRVCGLRRSPQSIRLMTAGPWTLPARLRRLVELRWWPYDYQSEIQQNLHSLIPEDRVRAFAPEERIIYFNRPPFHAVSALLASNEQFWTSELACPSGISFEHTVVLGDFGLGSDAPIVLDYRTDAMRPSVLRLRYSDSTPNTDWVTAAVDFETMCDILQIPQS
jgi:hypothetical protein